MDDAKGPAQPDTTQSAPNSADPILAPVAGFDDFEWPPPSDWQKLERLCHALWQRMWNDPHAQRNGRPGQKQAGVDIFGTPKGQARVHGIQCKRKDTLLRVPLKEAEVYEEVENAKAFEPPLAELIIVTTAPSDAALQEVARKITKQHLEVGLFRVSILGWTEVLARLTKYADVVAQFYPVPAVRGVSDAPAAGPSGLHAQLLTGQVEIKQRLEQLVALHRGPNDGVTHAQLDICRDLIETHAYRAALPMLERIKDKEWTDANPALRFRIATNLGAVHLGLGQYQKAAEQFLEAFRFDPSNEKALTNRAIALLLLERPIEALAAAKEAVSAHPGSGRSWAALVNVQARVDSDESIPEGPIELADNMELMFARADALAMRSHWDSAESLLRKILSSPHADVMAKSRLAEVLMARSSGGGRFYAGAPYSEKELNDIVESKLLLEQTWESVKRTDRAAGSVHVVQNLCAVSAVLGEMRQAETAVDEGLAAVPDHPDLLAWKIRIAASRDDGESALRALSRLRQGSVEEYALLQAAAYRASGNKKLAADALEAFIQASPDSKHSGDARCLFADLVCELDLVTAEARFNGLPLSGTPAVARSTIIFARALRDAGAAEPANRYLIQAREQLAERTDSRDLLMLADALADFGEHSSAIGIYEKYVSPATDTPSLRAFIRSLFQLDQRRRMSALLSSLHPSVAAMPAYQYFRANLALRAGDLQLARECLERCLTANPDGMRSRLLWAQVCIRMDKTQDALPWISALDLRSRILTLDQLLELGQIFHALGLPKDAATAFYQALRRFPNDPRSHLAFTASILLKGSTEWQQSPNAAVALDTAVVLQDLDGRPQIYILEDLPDAQLQGEEISIASPLALRLLGKKVGDTVTGHSSELATHQSTIVSVQHKYVRAMQESLQNFNTRFPEAPGLVGMRMPVSGTPEEQVAPVRNAVKGKAAMAKQVQSMYQQGLPIASLGMMMGSSAIEAWRSLIGRAEERILVCNGSVDEREAARGLLSEKRRGYMPDAITLAELHFMDALEIAEAVCGRMAIAQATLEELQGLIRGLELHHDGYSVFFERDGQLYLNSVSPRKVREERQMLASLLDWARRHCDVVPALPAVDVAPEMADKLSRALGPAYETLLAAQGGSCVILSDDWHFRRIAQEQFQVPGIWVQAMLFQALRDGRIQGDHYDRCTSKLAVWKHHFTAVSWEQLLFAATRGRWIATPEFQALAATLDLKHSEPNILSSICLRFLKNLWKKGRGPSRGQAAALTRALLDGINPAASPHNQRFFYTFRELARRGQLPSGAWEAIETWYRKAASGGNRAG